MSQNANLKLETLAIGSLPHNDVNSAMKVVEKDFNKIPFWPQLANVSKNEDMIIQFLEGMPSFLPYNSENFSIDTESEKFFEDLEEFFVDYEEIIADINSPKLEKYGISENFSSTFPKFEQIISATKPQFAKGQITGPFTLATSINDKNGKCIIYDETLKEVVVKLLTLKVLWQIKHIKSANPETTPIIFIDEPSISQIGTSAYLTISEMDVIDMLKEISDVIKENGGISAIHCCGRCDWLLIPIAAEFDIINFDAYAYSETFAIYRSIITKHLNRGGKIAFGIVPTLDAEALDKITLEDLVEKFDTAVRYLTNKGIDEKLIIDNSLVSTSCGAGSLNVELAEKAMKLTKRLSLELKSKYN